MEKNPAKRNKGKRNRPRTHERKSYRKKNGTQVRGTVVNPELYGNIRRKKILQKEKTIEMKDALREMRLDKTTKRKKQRELLKKINDKIDDSEQELGKISNNVDDLTLDILGNKKELREIKREKKEATRELNRDKRELQKQIKNSLKI